MKITTKKRLEKALKIGAVVLAGLVLLVLLVGVGASCIKDKHKNRELITCAAEEAQLFAEEASPTVEEIIPVSSTHKLTDWDTIDYEAQKLIIHSNEYVFTGNEPFGVWSSEKMYAYSVGVLLRNEGSLDMTQIKSNFFDYPVLSMTGTTAAGCTSVYFRFPVETYPEFCTIENFKSWLVEQSTKGNPLKVTYKTEAAYSVGLDYFSDLGYENGYEAGIEDGGLFHGVKLSAETYLMNWIKELSYTGSPRKTLNGLVFDDLVSYIDANSDTSKLWGVTLTIEFGKAVPVYHYSFKQTGATEKRYVTAYFDNGEHCACYFAPEAEGGKLIFSGAEYLTAQLKDLKITKLVFDRSNMSLYWLRKLTISYEDTAYESGYAIGKKEGEDNAVFTFDNLKSGFFSILDAPFKAIKDALNFEFLGINISNLVLFLLTVIVVIIIIKKAVGK